LGLGKSLTGLGLKKFKKPWAWARQKNAQPLYCTKKNVEISIFTTKKCRNLHFPNKKKDRKLDHTFSSSFRYINDVLSLNNSRFGNYLNRIYPNELEVMENTDIKVCFLPWPSP
jgi:hypothetical protein